MNNEYENKRFLRNTLKVLKSYHAATGGEQSELLNVAFVEAALKIIEHKQKTQKKNIINFPTQKRGCSNGSKKKYFSQVSEVVSTGGNLRFFSGRSVFLSFSGK